METKTYTARVRGEFTRLLGGAEQRNLLYFLMILFTNWPSLRWSKLFYDRVIEISVRLLRRATDPARKDPLEPHETLVVLQINLEAKALNAQFKNFISLARGRYVQPEPWDRTRGEYQANKGGRVTVSTARILLNLVEDLRCAEFKFLAAELDETHVKSLGKLLACHCPCGVQLALRRPTRSLALW